VRERILNVSMHFSDDGCAVRAVLGSHMLLDTNEESKSLLL